MPKSEKTLRVVIATPLGPKGQGGMDRLTDLIVETFDSRPDTGIHVVPLTTRGQRSIYLGAFVFAHAMARFWFAARRGEVDLLHLNVAAGGSVYRKLILAQIARQSAIPYVVHLHGSRFHQFWASAGPRSRRAIEKLFAESEHTIVLGQFWERLVGDHLPKIRDKITILPNATKSVTSAEMPKGESVRITFLGQLGERKGTFHLIEALARLKSLGHWSATIAGNGEVEKCRALADSLEIADRVKMPGWLDPAGVDELLRRTDIFVLPSTAENLPMAILESFAFGIAVVATPVGAVPEVIDHGRNGLIVPVGDVDALAAALRSLIEDPELRSRLGQAARRDHARHYDVGIYVTRLAAIWRRAALRSGLSPSG
jgi:glycosyltransferase involved in cell wall biosynthesis